MENQVRQIINLDNDWMFKKGMDLAGFSDRIDDADWCSIHLPHDWSIFGPFKEDNPSGPRGGYAPAGIAWYRKHLHVPQDYANKKIYIEFDGVYMNSEVHMNGERVGKYPYGYTTLYYDITSYLKYGEDNLLSVKVDTSTQPSSRWYSGSGIYRHVRLIVTDKLHIGQWGTYVTTPEVDEKEAWVKIDTTLVNETNEHKNVTIQVSLLNEAQSVVGKVSKEVAIDSNSEDVFSQEIRIKQPELWSMDNPYLYQVQTEIISEGCVVDNDLVTMGIRSIVFDANKGFFLNGTYTKIKGVCLHHDGGALGAACPDRAKERQLQILKEMGCNAIRTSHNPPSPVLLDLCDQYGMLVMDEVFDEYQIGKRPRVFDVEHALDKQVRRPIFAYAEVFDAYHEKDLTTMIKRDRNHPSIILWSIGNEITEHRRPEGVELTKGLHDLVKAYDTTRPTITGIVHLEGANTFGIPDMVDIAGYNYKETLYEKEHAKYPARIILGSETSSAAPFEMRAVYDDFLQADTQLKTFDDVTKELGDIVSIHSDHRYIRGEHSWKITNDLDYISGLFIWTGFDYIGEPSPYAWPSKTSYFGVIDTCGFPKDAYYMYQSQWTTKPMLHVFPHWNWEDKAGQHIPVWCYTNCDSVELFLNDRSLGEKHCSDTELLHVSWSIPYVKGTLRAVGKKENKIVLEKVMKTAGDPYAIVLEADRKAIQADSQDLAYITVKVVDKEGTLVPTAKNLIQFRVEGEGRLIGVDNGDPTSLEAYKGAERSTLGGLCLAIAQSTYNKGKLVVTAESEGLVGCQLVLTSI